MISGSSDFLYGMIEFSIATDSRDNHIELTPIWDTPIALGSVFMKSARVLLGYMVMELFDNAYITPSFILLTKLICTQRNNSENYICQFYFAHVLKF